MGRPIIMARRGPLTLRRVGSTCRDGKIRRRPPVE